jgi:hypothetical protein
MKMLNVFFCCFAYFSMFNYVPIKHKQMSFVSNAGKFKLYAVLNGLIFSTLTQPRISFEQAIVLEMVVVI